MLHDEAMPRDDEVDHVLDAARAQPTGTPGLEELAAEAHFSRFHLSRVLRARLGYPLRDFLAALRVERGMGALLEGHDVTRAQTEAGHESASSFTRSFARHTGMAPSTYRAQAKFLGAFLLRRMNETTPIVAIHRSFDGEPAQAHPLTVKVAGAQPGAALFVALHHAPIVHGAPLLGIAMLGTAEHEVASIPDGTYYAMVVEVPRDASVRAMFDMAGNRRDLRREPITFPLPEPREVTLTLRDFRSDDPPITLPLPKLFADAVQGRITIEESNSGQAPPSPSS